MVKYRPSMHSISMVRTLLGLEDLPGSITSLCAIGKQEMNHVFIACGNGAIQGGLLMDIAVRWTL
jgi:hypothetical protein